MKDEIIKLYATREERYEVLLGILEIDNFSIAEIVLLKEKSLQQRISDDNKLISGLALRATTMFGISPKEVLGNIEMVKPLVAQDILKSGVVKGTPFEKELLAQYPANSPNQ
jgi:hypothetical protein